MKLKHILFLVFLSLAIIPFASAGSATGTCGSGCPAECATHGVSCTSTACSLSYSGIYRTCCYDPPCVTPCWVINGRRTCGAPCRQCASTECAASPTACSATSRTNEVGTASCTYLVDSTIQSCTWVDCTTETCDNVDNDCDGSIDEGLTQTGSCSQTGACSGAYQTCSAGSWGSCSKVAGTESCNNVDDDCDGSTDESLTQTGTCSQTGYCSGAYQTCSAGSWGSCSKVAGTESCNNVDDDCDGSTDEDLTQIGSCNQLGYCSGAYQTCSAGAWGTCSKLPQTEICDNVDNDCDGIIDENVTRTTACNQVGYCSGAYQTCSAGAWGICSKLPRNETCNNIDDNCDGTVDGITNTTECNQVGYCAGAYKTCTAGAWGVCSKLPIAENTVALCSDGIDNDCDGLIDAQEIVTCDFTTPNITSITNFPLEPVIQENINISTTVVEDNIFNISVYADNSEIAKCLSQRECSGRVSYGNIGYHNYLSYSADWAGHYAVSPTKNFTVGGDPIKTCLENTGNFGSVCDENYYCGSGGAFVNSQNGGVGDNQFSQQPGDAKCCTTGDCTSSYVMPKCEGPPVFGVEYNPEIAVCNGYDVIAEVEEPESIKCCAGTITAKAGNMQEFDSYWSRQNSGYFKLAEAAEGDHLYCMAINQTGLNTVSFTIQKGETKTYQNVTSVSGVAMMPVTAEETGTYTCTAEMNGAVKSSEIKVTEAGKDPTKLPVFGIIQIIIALSIIGIYYGKKK